MKATYRGSNINEHWGVPVALTNQMSRKPQNSLMSQLRGSTPTSQILQTLRASRRNRAWVWSRGYVPPWMTLLIRGDGRYSFSSSLSCLLRLNRHKCWQAREDSFSQLSVLFYTLRMRICLGMARPSEMSIAAKRASAGWAVWAAARAARGSVT